MHRCSFTDLRIKERAERLPEGHVRLVLVGGELEALVQGLVHPSTNQRCGNGVLLDTGGDEVEYLVEAGLDLCEVRPARLDQMLSGHHLPTDPVLLGPKLIERHGPRVVGLQELVPLTGELVEAVSLTFGLGLSRRVPILK